MIGDAKTKKSNKMGPEFLDSLSFINSNMKSKGKNCLDLARVIDDGYLRFHNQQMNDSLQEL